MGNLKIKKRNGWKSVTPVAFVDLSSRESDLAREARPERNAMAAADVSSVMDSMNRVVQPALNSTSGQAQSTRNFMNDDSMYDYSDDGDHVITGVIHPISGAVPVPVSSQRRHRHQHRRDKYSGGSFPSSSNGIINTSSGVKGTNTEVYGGASSALTVNKSATPSPNTRSDGTVSIMTEEHRSTSSSISNTSSAMMAPNMADSNGGGPSNGTGVNGDASSTTSNQTRHRRRHRPHVPISSQRRRRLVHVLIGERRRRKHPGGGHRNSSRGISTTSSGVKGTSTKGYGGVSSALTVNKKATPTIMSDGSDSAMTDEYRSTSSGDHVITGIIHPISGAVPVPVSSQRRSRHTHNGGSRPSSPGISNTSSAIMAPKMADSNEGGPSNGTVNNNASLTTSSQKRHRRRHQLHKRKRGNHPRSPHGSHKRHKRGHGPHKHNGGSHPSHQKGMSNTPSALKGTHRRLRRRHQQHKHVRGNHPRSPNGKRSTKGHPRKAL
ncbi:hypothetical protein NPIL_399153 [Nephila pilipes]|uniref:Uncharacterized protein n=1 Tax=Nephila pilipes TaxID=299642 RepID=A0A8X6TGZ4_NEPPI|nr:hypothetical protein NPIL_399153 [Nephila pilipes]